MLIWCSRNISYIIVNAENSRSAYICGNHDIFQDSFININLYEIKNILWHYKGLYIFTGTLYIHTFWQILFFQSNLHYIQGIYFVRLYFCRSLGIEPKTLMLLAPCSTVLATAFPLTPGLFTVIAHCLFLFAFPFKFFIYLLFSVQLLWNFKKMLHK